jgi:predicted metal-dependent hydrolase
MNIEQDQMTQMTVNGIIVNIVRKLIKNIHLGVYPPSGRVRLAVPLRTPDNVIRLFIISKMSWIKRQKSRFDKQERQGKRDYVSGESHYFLGNRYRLNLVHSDSIQKVEVQRRSFINLYIKPHLCTAEREKMMNAFYRRQLRKYAIIFVEKWQKIIGVRVKEVRIKKMKTRWGTCTPKDGRVWINLELAKKPLHCIEYIIVHELIHLLEEDHTECFDKIIEGFLPKWRHSKDELNQSVLGYCRWNNQMKN